MLDPKLQAFLDFYNSLSANGLDAIADYYAEQVQFIDPVHEINSRSALQHYLAHGYQRLNYARFTPVSGLCQGERGFLSWQMRFSHPAFAKGQEILVHGSTELAWQDGRICYHRDYYDLTEMVYQHIPVLGWLTRQVKQKIAAS